MAVRVVSVALRDFRTYPRAEARLGPGLNVVHGPNGAGKSNLLEAIYYGCTARSPRTRNERELVRFGASTTHVALRLCDGRDERELAVGFGSERPQAAPLKRMRADGAQVERLLDVPFRPLVSVFMPDRLELVKGAPAARRAHLDQLLAAVWPARAQARRDYSRALAQRNALLLAIRSGRAGRGTMPAWDRELSMIAFTVREYRGELTARLGAPFSELARALGLSGEAELRYRPAVAAVSAEELCEQFAGRLERDIERGFTSLGPHRDELALLRDGRELRTYGSQGEQRIALLALLLAERAVLAQARGELPLMLLDDVMSELDSDRRELLAAELCSGGQSVIASTDLAHVPGALESSVTRLRISPGAILQEAIAA